MSSQVTGESGSRTRESRVLNEVLEEEASEKTGSEYSDVGHNCEPQ